MGQDDEVALVFGGGGFVGKSVCRSLAARGVRVVAVEPSVPEGLEVEALAGDVTDPRRLAEIFEQIRPTRVVHLAALLSVDADADPVRATEVNVMGTLNVLEATRRAGVRRFVYSSSIAVYGDQPDWGDKVLVETDHGRPSFFYGWHKQMNEASAAFYEEHYDMCCIGLRISTVYGPGRKVGGSAFITQVIESAGNEPVECPVGPDSDSCMIHVDDCGEALAILTLAESPNHSIYNVGGEFSLMGQVRDLVAELRPDVELRLAPAGTRLPHVSRLSAARLEEEFGFRPRSFTESVRQMVRPVS